MYYYKTYSPNKEIVIISVILIIVIILLNINLENQQQYLANITNIVSDISDKSAKTVKSVRSVIYNEKTIQTNIQQTHTQTNEKTGIYRLDYKNISFAELSSVSKTAKLNTVIHKTTATETFYVYIPHKWKAKYNWLIKDIDNDKYYIPEGLLKITKGTIYEWLPLEFDTTLTYKLLQNINYK